MTSQLDSHFFIRHTYHEQLDYEMHSHYNEGESTFSEIKLPSCLFDAVSAQDHDAIQTFLDQVKCLQFHAPI